MARPRRITPAPVIKPAPKPAAKPAPASRPQFTSTTIELVGDIVKFVSPEGRELRIRLTEQALRKVRLLSAR